MDNYILKIGRIIAFAALAGLFIFTAIDHNEAYAAKKEPGVYFTDTTDKLYIWDSYQFTAEAYKLGEKVKLRFRVSDTSVASIGKKSGILSAKKIGKVTVTVTDSISGESASHEVIIITGPTKPISEITDNRYTRVNKIYYKTELVSGGAVETTDSSLPDEDTGKYNPDVATISLTGDIMCLRAQQNAAKSNGIFNFNSSFKYIKKLFKRTDYAIGNLETLISYSNPITSVENTVNEAPNCNAPGTFLDALRYAGFCSVATANNHCCDGDVTGILETLEVLDRYDIAHVGTYRNTKTSRYILADINGIKVAFLSYTELINQRSWLTESEHKKYVGRYNIEVIKNDIAAAKEAGAEFIIAYNHWGTENTHNVTARQKNNAQAMADAGVDLIIGSHSHCLQKAEYIKSADGRKVLCVYSMGNFVSSMASTINNDTIVLEITLKRSRKTGEVSMKSAGYIPCRVFSSYGSGKHVVIPVSSSLNGGITNNTLTLAANRIRAVMGNAISEIKE